MSRWCQVLVIALVAGGLASEGDSSDNLDSRIAVSVASYNYTVAVLEQASGTHVASGALVTAGYALSSALGLAGYSASQIYVRAGSTLDYSGGTVVYVDTIYIHPNHTVTYDYDLAVLKLSVPVTLSSAVGVASLPVQQDQSFVPASNAALTGWGGPSTVCTEYTQLQYAAINLYANSYCQSNYANDLINDRLLCSEYASGDSTATCIGDPGAPLVVNGVLVGLLAYHYSGGHPVVFTAVSEYVTYIDSIVSTGSTTTTTVATTTCSVSETVRFILDLIVTTLQFLITIIEAIESIV